MFTMNKLKQISFTCGKFQNCLRSFSDVNNAVNARHTALYDFHLKHGGKMVNYGGYLLPVQYVDQGIRASHLRTRRQGSVFDVSHMLQTYVRGKCAISCMESLCTADIQGMPDGTSSLTVFTNSNGGIFDDLIVSKVNGHTLYVVSNAEMKTQDMVIMQDAVDRFKAQGKDVNLEFLPTSDQSLIAVQGPEAVSTLEKLLPKSYNLDKLYFMHTSLGEVAGVANCRITRCGYTGEDGVEVSVPSTRVQHVTEALLDANRSLKLAGLGARDSLRLEAGLCLYGSDINAETTPVEAGLAWLVARRRRNEANFPGASHILTQLQPGTKQIKKRRIGLVMNGQKQIPPARAGVQIYAKDRNVGYITSGCPSPSLGKNVAMGYISEDLKKPGTLVQLKIRDTLYEATIVRMPFVNSNYYINPNK
ncbi:PREDICTED: aminomethyltransferase, mitochondrial [Rhagoletis zephyria]|uniref:aminomethyltransferase, mitochondrial n=1 Tax=Rhagoletis zephyria TaxID=28612 RepID=UPI0008114D56|nr:PREDICTED: aminomethyltransferase, mitochondrial [Rhagoletis zephyria]XP_036335166.1 aminomethyltransferase, mitochondrial [Rhagoletis pomonella]